MKKLMFWAAAACVGQALTASAAMETTRKILVYNEDDSHYFMCRANPDYAVTQDEAGLRGYVRRIAKGGKVTHYFMCPNAKNANWDSKVMSPEWAFEKRPGRWTSGQWQLNLKKLSEAGVDPYAIWGDEARKCGLSPWLSIRMNDIHNTDQKNHALHSDFWLAHPEFRRMPKASGRNWQDLALDYSHKEVRDYMIRFLEEAFSRYDVDGVELDWMRGVYHLTPGKARAQSACLDEVVAAARKFAEKAAARLGHPVKVGVRIPTRPDDSLDLGMDFVTWAKNGWIDWIIPCNYFFQADFDLPYADWAKRVAAVNPKVIVVPGLDAQLRENGLRQLTREEYAVFADRVYRQGAPGVYIFNPFCHHPKTGVWRSLVDEGLPPALVAERAKGVKVPKGYDLDPSGNPERSLKIERTNRTDARPEGPTVSAAKYEAKWASLDKRPTPSWWTEAKFGIFIHWGPYAVPAFAPVPKDGKFNWNCYSEWYQGKQHLKEFADFHRTFYHGSPYGNFAAEFKAEHFDPDAWAELFKKAGAKYVVLTSKHHDGYALWPSPESPYYNAKAMGSGRDLAGEFCAAMRKAGLKRGFYFSMLEYANPLYPAIRDGKSKTALSIEEWNARVNLPQLKELAENYEADIIWPDGEWDYPSARHCSEKYLAWLFNESKVKDTVVVNDRWGKDCRGHHGGHYTTEYALEGGDTSGNSATHPWEECRGIGNSFGYNRFETPDHYMTRERCVETLVNCVSRGGNLLLNVGPTADGRIPAIMQDRLLAIGAWLKVNGEAIYGSRRWSAAPKDFAKRKIYFTAKDGAVYMTVFAKEQNKIRIPGLASAKSVTMLGTDAKIAWKADGDALEVEMPAFAPGTAPVEFAPTFKITL